MTDNPIHEALPTSLDELFSRDPLDLGRDDIQAIVTEFRRMREVWRKAEAMGAKKSPSAGPKRDIRVEDLDL